MSRARPTERAADPAPRAIASQPARAARAPPAAASDSVDGDVAAVGFRRGGEGWDRFAAEAPFDLDVPCDLVGRAPERAAVLFAMAED
jgi:hypothetical protein